MDQKKVRWFAKSAGGDGPDKMAAKRASLPLFSSGQLGRLLPCHLFGVHIGWRLRWARAGEDRCPAGVVGEPVEAVLIPSPF